LPALSLQDWFEPFVHRWLARKEQEFFGQYIKHMLLLEERNGASDQ
jgi:hypothetical protein